MPGFQGFLGGAGTGAGIGSSFGPVGTAVGGALGGLLGLFGGSDNSNEFAYQLAQQYQQQANQFLDPNNPFYRNASNLFYKDLNKTLNESSPGIAGLLGLSSSQGNSFGTSQAIANQQRQSILARNRDSASRASDRFEGGLYQQGLGVFKSLQNNATNLYNLYGGGASQQQNLDAGFNNSLLTLGGGLLGRYFNQGSDGIGGQGADTQGFQGNNNQQGGFNPLSPQFYQQGFGYSPFG